MSSLPGVNGGWWTQVHRTVALVDEDTSSDIISSIIHCFSLLLVNAPLCSPAAVWCRQEAVFFTDCLWKPKIIRVLGINLNINIVDC